MVAAAPALQVLVLRRPIPTAIMPPVLAQAVHVLILKKPLAQVAALTWLATLRELASTPVRFLIIA